MSEITVSPEASVVQSAAPTAITQIQQQPELNGVGTAADVQHASAIAVPLSDIAPPMTEAPVVASAVVVAAEAQPLSTAPGVNGYPVPQMSQASIAAPVLEAAPAVQQASPVVSQAVTTPVPSQIGIVSVSPVVPVQLEMAPVAAAQTVPEAAVPLAEIAPSPVAVQAQAPSVNGPAIAFSEPPATQWTNNIKQSVVSSGPAVTR